MNEDFQEREVTVSSRSFLAQIIYLISGLITAILAIRFFLVLFNANRDNGFATLIYKLSDPLVRPFYGLFDNQIISESTSGRFEYESIIAIIVYAIIAWLLIKLVGLGKRSVAP